MMESYYWKAQIRRKAMSLERRRLGRRWPSRSIDFFERELMIGFFCVRKLIESKKLTDACTKHTICALKYPLKGKITGLHDFVEFDHLYDLSLGDKCNFNVEFVANLLIH